MKARIRRISASVDTAISFGSSSSTQQHSQQTSSSSSSSGASSGVALGGATVTASESSLPIATASTTMSGFGKHSHDSPIGSGAGSSTDQSPSTYNNSKSLDIQCVPESRIEKMRKLLSSPLLRKRNSSNCHHHHHHHRDREHHSAQSPHNNPTQTSQQSPSTITKDANSSPSSSPSSSPALGSSASMRTFGVSLESLAHHQHPHHQQTTYEGQLESEEFYARDPELVVVPHQKAAHILGQACAGCLTSAPSNSSSMGSIHESAHHGSEDCIPASSSPGTSSSSTTSSTSSVHGCGQTSSHYLIPFIVTRLCNYIETKHGITHEGLFRVSGNAKLVEKLKKSFDDSGDAPLEFEADLGSATTLLKQFLRELPNALIPNGTQFLDVLRSLKNDRETCILALKALVSQLPDENYFTLRYLMRFLHRIALRNDENRMSATNLGIVFAPNLFRVCVDTYQGLKDQSTANEVVHLLITEFNEIFGESHLAAADLSREDLSVDLSECPFNEEEQMRTSGSNVGDNFENACTRSLIDFRAEQSVDLDRKRKDFQSGSSRRSTIEDFYDNENAQRSQSVELGLDQISTKTKTNPEVERESNIISTGSRCHHAEIIVTNSSDSVSTDDNTATTATSTGATVCSVLIGSNQRGRSLEPGPTNIRHLSSSDEGADRSTNSLPVRTARSGSCSSDCTENQNLRISLSEDEDGSLSRSIASACLTDDGEESDDTSSSILDGDTSGNEAGSSSSMNETEPEVAAPETVEINEDLAIEPDAWRSTITRPTILNLNPNPTVASTTATASTGAHIPIESAESTEPSRNNSVRRQNKRFSSIRRKLRQFENDFHQENGFTPTFDHKMASSFARPLMLELSNILNLTTPSLRDIDLDAADPAKADAYREASPTRNFTAARQANKRFPVNWRGPNPTGSATGAAICGGVMGAGPNVGNSCDLSNDDIFNTIFGRPADKHLQQLKETMADIEQKLMERRQIAQRPEVLDEMTNEQVQDEKLALQKALLRFEALYGRPSTKAERDIVRPVYDRYRAVKRRATSSVANAKAAQSVAQQNPSGASATGASTTTTTTTAAAASAIAANELAPIIENVQMDFKSPTTVPKSALLLEFEIEKSNSNSKRKQHNYHEMTQEELKLNYDTARQQKRNVRMVLRTFESDFQKRTGRRVEREDRCNMAAAYSAYKNIKAKIRLIEALLKKNGPKTASATATVASVEPSTTNDNNQPTK